MTARARKQPAPAAPVTAIVESALQTDGTRTRQFSYSGVRVTVATIDDSHDQVAAELIQRLHAVCSIPPALSRLTEWGPGQFDHVKLGPGVEAWLRVTPGGRVRMVVPGGDLDVTEGGSSLGAGLQEAGARAAQVRVKLVERATARAERLGHDPVWHGLRGVCSCRRCEATGEIDHDGKGRGELFAERCKP